MAEFKEEGGKEPPTRKSIREICVLCVTTVRVAHALAEIHAFLIRSVSFLFCISDETGLNQRMEQTQLRMNEAVNNLIDELDKTYLRDIQKKMFNCSAECCNDKIGPRESIEQCVERCNGPMKSAQKSLEREIGALQDQLSRCSMTVGFLNSALLYTFLLFSATTSWFKKWGRIQTSIVILNWLLSMIN